MAEASRHPDVANAKTDAANEAQLDDCSDAADVDRDNSRLRSARLCRAIARRCQGGVGHRQGASRDDAHSRANLPQRPVAMAARRRPIGTGARPKLGLLQGPRKLARNHRLHAEGFADGFCSSRLARSKVREHQRRLVSTGIHGSPRVGRAPRRHQRRVSAFVKSRWC